MAVLCRAEQGPHAWRSGRQTAAVTDGVPGHGAKPGDTKQTHRARDRRWPPGTTQPPESSGTRDGSSGLCRGKESGGAAQCLWPWTSPQGQGLLEVDGSCHWTLNSSISFHF